MLEIDALEYNTARPKMLIPEYGRNVQKMVDHAVSIVGRDERNRVAESIIKVMGELKPELHLFIMSNFELDVDSPYPLPNRETLSEPPARVAYPQSPIKIGHYGKNAEKLITKALEMEDEEEKMALVHTIACLMKQFYLTFNSTSIEDDMIIDHLSKLSNGKIKLTDVSFLPSTASVLKSQGISSNSSNNSANNGSKKPNKNRNKNQNQNQNRNKNNRKRF
jgi:hypothetical protein